LACATGAAAARTATADRTRQRKSRDIKTPYERVTAVYFARTFRATRLEHLIT
jgi:diaminopimelate epimerase